MPNDSQNLAEMRFPLIRGVNRTIIEIISKPEGSWSLVYYNPDGSVYVKFAIIEADLEAIQRYLSTGEVADFAEPLQ